MKLNSIHDAVVRRDPNATWRYLYTFELPRNGGPVGSRGFLNPWDPEDPLIIDARRAARPRWVIALLDVFLVPRFLLAVTQTIIAP